MINVLLILTSELRTIIISIAALCISLVSIIVSVYLNKKNQRTNYYVEVLKNIQNLRVNLEKIKYTNEEVNGEFSINISNMFVKDFNKIVEYFNNYEIWISKEKRNFIANIIVRIRNIFSELQSTENIRPEGYQQQINILYHNFKIEFINLRESFMQALIEEIRYLDYKISGKKDKERC